MLKIPVAVVMVFIIEDAQNVSTNDASREDIVPYTEDAEFVTDTVKEYVERSLDAPDVITDAYSDADTTSLRKKRLNRFIEWKTKITLSNYFDLHNNNIVNYKIHLNVVFSLLKYNLEIVWMIKIQLVIDF